MPVAKTSCKGLKPFKRLRRWQMARLGRPSEAIDVALGCLLLRKTSSTPAVVPGAAPALAKAGVGGYIYTCQRQAFCAFRSLNKQDFLSFRILTSIRSIRTLL